MITITTHDALPEDKAARVDAGLGEANDTAAPLDEVRPLACFAMDEAKRVVGGAVGRRWGESCELLQLWVDPAHRRQGLATRLVLAFEAHAAKSGCASVYLETYSFQAPSLYEALGYQVEYERADFPHRVVKYHMMKMLDGVEAGEQG